jgi:hypothetical protein
VPTDFEDLKRRNQQNLITFMEREAELASTFCAIAERTSDAKHKAKLLEDVRKAVDAIRHFGERITDSSIRAKLKRDANRIEKLLAMVSEGGRPQLSKPRRTVASGK